MNFKYLILPIALLLAGVGCSQKVASVSVNDTYQQPKAVEKVVEKPSKVATDKTSRVSVEGAVFFDVPSGFNYLIQDSANTGVTLVRLVDETGKQALTPGFDGDGGGNFYVAIDRKPKKFDARAYAIDNYSATNVKDVIVSGRKGVTFTSDEGLAAGVYTFVPIEWYNQKMMVLIGYPSEDAIIKQIMKSIQFGI